MGLDWAHRQENEQSFKDGRQQEGQDLIWDKTEMRRAGCRLQAAGCKSQPLHPSKSLLLPAPRFTGEDGE